MLSTTPSTASPAAAAPAALVDDAKLLLLLLRTCLSMLVTSVFSSTSTLNHFLNLAGVATSSFDSSCKQQQRYQQLVFSIMTCL
jgi:hypothetical protein